MCRVRDPGAKGLLMDQRSAEVEEFFARAFPHADALTLRRSLIAAGRLRSYDARTIVAFEGDRGIGIACVLSGSVISIATCPNRGREVVVSHARPGTFLHDFAWHDLGTIPLTLRAASRTTIFTVDRVRYDEALRRNATFRAHALAAESRAQRDLVERVRQLAFYDVRTRIARYLIAAEARGERVETRTIAAANGTVHDVAWRILREFQTAGVVAMRERATHITDRPRLARVGRFAR